MQVFLSCRSLLKNQNHFNKMKSLFSLFSLSILVGLVFNQCSSSDYMYDDKELEYQNQDFYEVKIYDDSLLQFENTHPKNIILLIGDGMGVSQVFAGLTANKGKLNLLNLKTIGFSKTQSSSDYITDSAAGGTALACGKKTYNGAIGVDPNKNSVTSILEIAEEHNIATGLVSTSSIVHATPASFIAHQPDRDMYEEIAADFLNTEIDVFIGGGMQYFTEREDKRNLVKELEEKGYTILDSLEKAQNLTDSKLGVLTAQKHNDKFSKRGEMLKNATHKALEILSKDEKGFFLMVEGSQIDWGGHQNNTAYIVGEMLDFDKMIGEVLEFAIKDQETLVIVTADHETGGFGLNESNMAKGFVNGDFISDSHTGVMVPVFAVGPGAEEFMGIYENTAIFDKMLKLYNFN